MISKRNSNVVDLIAMQIGNIHFITIKPGVFRNPVVLKIRERILYAEQTKQVHLMSTIKR